VRPPALTISSWYFSGLTPVSIHLLGGWDYPLTIAGEITESKGCLALNLETLTVHERHKAGHKLRLALSKLFPVRTVDCNIAESRRAVVLNVCIWRVEKADKNRDSTGVDKLLPVLIYPVISSLEARIGDEI
jgi:hypothetical protein